MDVIPELIPAPSLESVLASPARFRTARILSRLPDKEFTGRELAGTLGLSHSTIQATMRTFVDAGVARERRIGRACVFRANRDSALLGVLDRLFRAEEQAKEALVKSIQDAMDKTHSAVILFGSVARGEATRRSDLDLLVVTKEPQMTSEALAALEERLIRRYGLHVDAKVVTPADIRASDKAYIKNALAEGRVIDPAALAEVMAAEKN